MKWWPWTRRQDPSASTPFIDWTKQVAPTDLLSFAGGVGERRALSLSAFYRAGALISSTLAALPMHSYTAKPGPVADRGGRKRVGSIFDDPDPRGQTAYEWKETLLLQLFIHGRAYCLKTYTTEGALAALPTLHPLSVTVQLPTPADYNSGRLPEGGKWFYVQLADGTTAKYDSRDVWEVPGSSTDGLSSFCVLDLARQSLSTSLAADRSAHTMMTKGAMISGLATPEDELEPGEEVEIRAAIDNATSGYDSAGRIAVVNRRLKFTPWTMSGVDAQFLQQRQFQIEEVARWTGVPPHALMQTEKQTSWGTGVEEQNRALGRTVLHGYAKRIEERASRLLASPRWVEFEFAALERPSPDKEIELLLAQTGKPFLTVNEARAIRNLPPIDGGDDLGTPAPAALPAAPDDEDDDEQEAQRALPAA